ncbi:hypothetical protein NA57DRAFT_42813 [Rhizodiscina lignyota]|uniref:HECT-type E3 ubiquitin transferase n=1 Tax=Rhizodiscina lignyota TaxID=1504668 RepID=A0A9P4I876_9PEZI|nr:hypothetical protein NA57DRAFT_42813 [Rhizodiscina lignyota]
MGKIHKTATARHEVSLSPAISEFISKATSIPLHQLPAHLSSFPRLWPFPRGDLYHWIPVLNRFDNIYELFNKEYGLTDGPQTQPFACRLLEKGDGESPDDISAETLASLKLSAEGDRELIEQILIFTKLLLDCCGNRSLYASSGQINHLLNTTSLSLLRTTLLLSLRLAQRYYSSRSRTPAAAQNSQNLLNSHYAINLDRMQRIAAPFARNALVVSSPASPSFKGKEKATGRVRRSSQLQAADLVTLVKGEGMDDTDWNEWRSISLSYYNEPAAADNAPRSGISDGSGSPTTPTTPAPARRPSNLGPNAASRGPRPAAAEESPSVRSTTDSARNSNQKHVEISVEDVIHTPSYELLRPRLPDLPRNAQYELLHKVRVAKGLGTDAAAREDIVAIRLLGLANLAYVLTESNFQTKIAQPDSEEPRRLQLPYQLTELIHPPGDASDVSLAMSVNVNHGVLFYLLRKAVAQLAEEETEVDFEEEEWREQLFALINSLPSSQQTHRTGEQMVSAGLLGILVDVLTLRTSKAERNHAKVLMFLDTFVYNLRDAFGALVNAKGLDIIADLCDYEVNSSFEHAKSGKSMPSEFKTQMTDYQIPYFQQQTLRWIFKFINHMMSHNIGTHDRVLRNLIDSPQLLNGLRTVLSNARVFGAVVWSGAANILSSFIHNEPTSYAVIAEAGLSKALLEAVTHQPEEPAETSFAPSSNFFESIAAMTIPSGPLATGILPHDEALPAIPQAFGAICLNEKGMRLFQKSGALEKFFDIFVSPEHVKVLDQEGDLPTALGNSFDELVRHHPPLRDAILQCVLKMIPRVCRLCSQRAEMDGAGAKLWKMGKDGELLVAGGRAALVGDQARATTGGEDVEMSGMEGDTHAASSKHDGEVSFNDIVDSEDPKKTIAPTQFISVACRFLRGFFSNTSLCSAFIEKGGLEYAIDFATLPCLPYNLHDHFSFSEELSGVLGMLVEQKPYLALPAIISRIQAATDELRPLLGHNDESSFFSIFTDPSQAEKLANPSGELRSVVDRGTSYVKALVILHTLCPALAGAFQTQLYNHRQTSNLFTQVNLTDAYVKLIDRLGQLQRSCVWEEILLQKHMPEKWELSTRITSLGVGSDEADNVLHINHTDAEVNGTNTSTAPPSSLQRQSTNGSLSSDSEERSAQFQNTRALRYLLSRIPTAINPFFQALGRILLLRRASDPYLKQNAMKVGDQLAKAAMDLLRFEAPRRTPNAKDRYAYWIITLTSVTQLMIDAESMERTYPQTLTLVLQAFKNQGGLAALGDILDTFFDEVKSIAATHGDEEPKNEVGGLFNLSLGGLKLILTFYSRIINAKYVNEALQTTALSSRADRDRDKPDFFLPGQFLVELRTAVVQQVQRLWNSEALEKGTTSIVKTLIEILRVVLDGDSETNAYKRSEKISRRHKVSVRKWSPRSPDALERLSEDFGDADLAREALFRCYDNNAAARDYCDAMKNHPLAERNPIPPEELQLAAAVSGSGRSPSSRDRSTGGTPGERRQDVDALRAALMRHREQAAHREEVQDTANGDVNSDLPVLPSLPPEESSSLSAILGAALASAGAAPAESSSAVVERPSGSVETSSEETSTPDVVTVDDLNDERTTLRKNLIDRSLDVLNVHEDVTFELSDLIAAATSKATDQQSMRAEIGSTLVQSLVSLQMEEDFRPQGKKIGAYAHLLALVLNNDKQDFYSATLDELKESLPMLTSFIKVFQDQKAEEPSSWIGPVLLILEKLLSNDAQPQEIKWKWPEEGVAADDTMIEVPEPVVDSDEKEHLFDAILSVLPRIGKDDGLALSALRSLVILTRSRQLAVRLSDKLNLSKLFTMMKQIAGKTNERMQSAFMLVLRHMVEDDETIRQIMRSDVQAMFESRSGRQIDTSTLPRSASHLILRNPEIFLEVVNEKLMIPHASEQQRSGNQQNAQPLRLKKEDAQPDDQRGTTLPEPVGGDEATGPDTKENNAEPSKNGDKPPLSRMKTADLKHPTVENPDGVIHFLLCELLAYKEVEDIEHPKSSPETAKATTSDVEMANGDGTSSDSSSTAPGAGPSTKSDFKSENHPIYIYRCFILQCLTELLSSYNRAKVEFINFSRKLAPKEATPSKPRSGVLNYLLNSLISIGTLNHGEDTAFRKTYWTSHNATNVIVALVTKTGEQVYDKSRDAKDYEDEPELVYVRKFVLEHALKSFKDAQSSSETLDLKYSRLLSLGNLFNSMLTSKPSLGSTNSHEMVLQSQKQLARIMYEKNFITTLTSAIADVDLNFPNAKRAVKYILKPLKLLTQTAIEISTNSDIAPSSTEEDEISTEASSVSDMDGDDREQTPDLFRNSTLGILQPNQDEDSDSDDDEDDDDEEMYEGDYGEEMDYEADHDDEDVISDDDEEIGPIEGLTGDVGMDVELEIMGADDADELSEDDSEDDDDIEDGEIHGTGDLEAMDAEDGEGDGAEDEWGTEEEDGEEYPGQNEIEDDEGHDHMNVIHIMDDEGAEGLLQRLEEDGLGDLPLPMEGGGDFVDDEIHDEEDDDEDEEEYDEEDIVYEPEFEDDDDVGLEGIVWEREGWGGPIRHEHGLHRAHVHHHRHHHGGNNPWHLFETAHGRDGYPYRTHRSGAQNRNSDDGMNPLLRRDPGGRRSESRSDWIEEMPGSRPRFFPTGGDGGPVSFISNLINTLANGGPGLLPQHQGGGGIQISIGGMHLTGLPPGFPALDRTFPYRTRNTAEPQNRTVRDDPASVVSFNAALTGVRWQEESKILFGNEPLAKAQRIQPAVLRLLVPPALEAQKIRAQKQKEEEEARKAKEEAEKAEREAKDKQEQEEREAREKKEREEREAAEAEEAARRTVEHPGAETEASEPTVEQVQEMEGVEQTQAESTGEDVSEPTPRVVTNIRGREIDITTLGIDLDYLEALPEDLREEVLMQQITQHRSEAADAPVQNEEIEIAEEFLNALPPEMREEILQQEAQDRRRREREEARRRNAATGTGPQAEEMDAASFIASLDPQLRQAVLMDQDEDVLNTLPAHLAAEARSLGRDRRLQQLPHMTRRLTRAEPLEQGDDHAREKKKPRPVIQMLDKAGVATLLRLMFVPQQGTSRQTLNGILHDVCENRQNRAEVVSLLLSILQDGSNDVSAVERSFAHLSIRAKSAPTNPKTPQPLKRTLSGPMPPANSDMSPMMVVQQCLNTLVFLTQHSSHIPWFFLTEHETATGFKSRSAKKGKMKESKASRYPLNALLGLLDRKLVIESSMVMEQLASLLQSITHPLNILLRKDKDKSKPDEEENKPDEEEPAQQSNENESAPAADLTASTSEQPATPGPATGEASVSTSEPAKDTTVDGTEAEKRKTRTLVPPEVPEHNLRLIVNILTARECSAKTFKDTITLITNLSAIPGAKETFGKELIKQAQELGKEILADLDELIAQVTTAKSGTDVQGMALAKFSPASSDQAKLLRVLTALDYLFDPKRAEENKPWASDIEGLPTEQKEDILTTLYENSTFGPLWTKLSECLTAIRDRGNMLNVATILLPLIEVLMVVCKNTTLKDAPLALTKTTSKDIALASPAPESRMENLFFSFTEDHRKILNDLVRNNPKLMSGSFALLVKNSKVLEFDNKRNYFNRKVHARGPTEIRQPHAPLQLSVRRDFVFLDSFKSLYFKSPDEMKYGKLSIRFHGEEGVDAGGVTREWFQVLAKQMFNADYALFNQVASDRTTFHPNPTSEINPEHLMFFRFIGRIIGKALYEGRVLDCHFSRAVYRRMLGKPVSIKDMESIDPQYYNTLVWMLENDITDAIFETFSIERDDFGAKTIIDLVENGRNIPVTEENKQDYVRLVAEWKMIGSVSEQLEYFLQGFHDIVPADLIAIFNEQELELLISGLPDIDVDDWKNNTDYQNYTAAAPQIQWFWRAVRSFDKEERAKLLQFVTGTSKVPLNGFKELEGMNGFSRFNIHRDYGSKDRLPSSHTCFNQLDLPEYESYDSLRSHVLTAITAGSEYFGFA